MNMERKIYINNDLDVVTARMQARELAKEMGFRTADQARISLAASELAKVLAWNTDASGEIIMSDTSQNGYQGFQVVCMVDLEHLSVDDQSSGLNRSLAGACQLVDGSIVEEQDTKLALVTLIKWLKHP